MPQELDDAGFDLLRRGQSADAISGVVGEATEKLQASVDARIFALLDGRQVLSPEAALQAWLEKYAYRRLNRELTKTVRAGRGAAKRLGEQFDTLSASVDAG